MIPNTILADQCSAQTGRINKFGIIVVMNPQSPENSGETKSAAELWATNLRLRRDSSLSKGCSQIRLLLKIESHK
ncbi:MAG: hypothetical protein CVU00_10905 [Bacteroidetes bacterium HGW-Bacteroidetes-17]|nr:MAG: hypothetical protein CVU00_10905 [Bacteroidetes bacterium HGW-Bacteroidetes-17]